MTPEQRAEIMRLAADAHDKAVRWHAMSVRNAADLSPDQRRQQAIAYAVAEAEMFESQARLDAAQRRPIDACECICPRCGVRHGGNAAGDTEPLSTPRWSHEN